VDGLLVAYVHRKVDGKSNAGCAGAIVEMVREGVEDAGDRKLAMHTVVANPEHFPIDAVEKERAILESQVSVFFVGLDLF
jgi:hypothetical protein